MYTEPRRRTRRFRPLIRRAVGVLDTLTAPHGVDRYMELVRPTWSTTAVRARVVRASRQTPGTVTLTLRPNGNWAGFEPGQHTQLTVEIDGVQHTRCYSMANSSHAGDGSIELSIKAHPHGEVSRYLLDHAHPGLTVGLSPAQGEFTLPAGRPDRLLLVSGGSGITPVMSMLRTLCDEGHSEPVTFVHYARSAVEMAYALELEELVRAHPNVRVVRVFTGAPSTGDLDGYLTPPQLAAADPDWAGAETYVCGPASLMEAMCAIFEEAGLSDRLHTEAFTLAHSVVDVGEAAGVIRFAATGAVVENDGRPVLQQAEQAGLSPASGCRMGICHTCTRRLCAGVVRDATTGELTNGPDVDIRICVSVPVGDIDIDL